MNIHTQMHTQAHIQAQTENFFVFGEERKMILETQESHDILIILNLIPTSIYKPFMIYQKMMPSTYRKPGFTNSRWPSITFLVMA